MAQSGLSEMSVSLSAFGTERTLVLSLSAFRPKAVIFSQCQIAQFDCSVCTGEEADETRTDRDDPRRIDIGHNSNVDEPSLQHSTANCAGKPKNDLKNEDERRLQGFFHCRSQRPVPGYTLDI
jgi:hypothetical protein